MAKTQTKKTLYGSGKVYSTNYSESEFPKVNDFKNLTQTESAAILAYIKEKCVPDNRIGLLKGGFNVNLTTSSLTDQDDLGELKVDVINSETATAGFNLFNVNGEIIAAQYPTATYSKVETDGSSLAAIGGIEHIDETVHVIIFHRADTENGDTYVICAGRNVSGLTVAYTPDSVTPMPVTINCEPLNDRGNLVWVYEPPKTAAVNKESE
ncbi:MAG: hypothetical protein NC120_05115 [Ruminococcus sp.]|nr:hypothetical protein [Ruminococcus sp.]